MIRFDEEKLRDITWKTRFNEKLAEIRTLQQKDSYIGYAMHPEIVEELKTIYWENVSQYETCYQKPKIVFERLSSLLDQLRSKLHPQHFTQLIDLKNDIEQLLEVEDYALNSRAIPLINDLEDQMNMFLSQMEAYRFNLKDLQEQLNDMQGRLWLEEAEHFERQFQRYKNGIQGDQLPSDVLLFDKSHIESLAIERTQAVDELLSQTQKYRSLSKEIVAKEQQPFSKKEFEQFEDRLKKAQNRRKTLWITLAGTGTVILILAGIFGPGWYKSLQMQKEWESLQSSPNYMGYETFIQRFEEGPLVAAAQQAQLDLKQGHIEGYVDSLGNIYDYEGELNQGHPQGTGRAIYQEGEVYQGEWEQGLREGIGTLTTPEGHLYEGQWQNNRKAGTGKQSYPNGDIYEGKWEQGLPNGEGTLITSDSSRYSGNWVEGKFEGKGTMKYSDGSRYVGQWKEGKREGNGTYYFTNGMRYEGKWKNGMREGKGTLIWENGKVFRGNWENDQQEGEGTLNWENGGVFVGIWDDGILNGPGSFTSRFRETYEGLFKEDSSGVIILYDSLGSEVRRGRFTKGMYVISR